MTDSFPSLSPSSKQRPPLAAQIRCDCTTRDRSKTTYRTTKTAVLMI